MSEKKVFAAIEAIEAQIEGTHVQRRRRQEELLVNYLQAREPLLQRRFELVTGRSEPTDEELQGFRPQGAAAAAAPEGASTGKGGGAKAGAGKGGAAGRGVPFFWLNALCNQEELSGLITPRDRCALEYLEDVRYLRGPAGMAVEFHFAPNPYFENKVLRKGVYVKRAPKAAGGAIGGPDDIVDAREEATVIDWKPGRSLLVRAEPPPQQKEKAQKQQGQKQGAAGGGKKGKKGKKAGGESEGKASTAAPSKSSRRHHGKHGGPAPDLPDPDEEGEEEPEQVEPEQEDQQEAEGEAAWEPGQGGRRRPCPSFFRFFLPIQGVKTRTQKEFDPTAEEDEDAEEVEDEEQNGDDDEEEEHGGQQGEGAAAAAARQAERNAADSRVLDTLIKKVVPRAVHLYLSAPVGGKGYKGAGAGGGGGGDEEEEGFQLVSGSPAGDVASLALGAQRALHALTALQKRLDELAVDFKRGEWECQVEQAREVARLAAQRRTLLVGPAGATTGKLSIPAFWLRALRATDVGASAVQHRDERALAALADVRLVWDLGRMPTPEDPTRCADLEFEFLPNPYFTNTVLRKRITFTAHGGSLNKLSVESTQSDPIDWQPGRDLTTRTAPAKEGGRAGRPRQVPSFFAFFGNSPGALCRAFDIAGQSRAAQAEALQAQEEFLGEIMNVVVQFAGRLAVESKVDVGDLGDEGEDEEEEEEEEEEDDDDEEEEEEDGEEAAARRAARRAAAAASRAARRHGGGSAGADGEGGGSWLGFLIGLFTGGLSGGSRKGGVVMMVFVAIMLLAQVLVFMETLDYVRARMK